MFDDDVIELIEAKKTGKHRCLNGRYVDCNSRKCRDDIKRRIKDMLYVRNNEECRTDARSYYSGVLKVLRRKLREVEKSLYHHADAKKTKKLNEDQQDLRLLKLAGIFK